MLESIARTLFREIDQELKDEFSKIYRKTLSYSECSECDCVGESKTTNDEYCVKCNHSKKNHKYSLEKGRNAVRMMLGTYCVALKRMNIKPPFDEIEKILREKMIPGVNVTAQVKKRGGVTVSTIFQYYKLIIIKLGMEQELPVRTIEDEINPIIRQMYAMNVV